VAIVLRRAGVKNAREYAVSAEGQTGFTLNELTYTPDSGALEVYVNGLRAYPVLDYIEVDSRTVRFNEPLPAGAELMFKVG